MEREHHGIPDLLGRAISHALTMDPRAPIDPKRLLVFREVVRAGSISGGARRLGWTQPAVSQHLGALERAVGMPLLLRGPRGVEPTEPGRALLLHADAVAARLSDARAEVDAFADRATGRVRVASFPSGAAVILPPALRRLADTHPSLRVDLTEAEPPEALELLRSGDADVALTFTYGTTDDLGPDVVATPVGADETRLVLGRNHQLAGSEVKLTDLSGEVWIAGCPRCSAHLHATTEAAGFVPDIRHTTDDYVLVQALVAQGLGVALLPETALLAYRHPDVLVRRAEGTRSRRHQVLHRAGAQHLPAVSSVIGAIGRTTPARRLRLEDALR